MCSSDAREIYHIHRISRKTHHSIPLNPLLLFLHAALEFLRLKVLATRTKHPYVQFTRLQRLSVGLSQRYATRFSDLVKWIKQSHMFTRGYAKHPCKQIKYSQRVAVCSIRPYPLLGRVSIGSPCDDGGKRLI